MGGLGFISPAVTVFNGFIASITRFFSHNIVKILPDFDTASFASSCPYFADLVSAAFQFRDKVYESLSPRAKSASSAVDVRQRHLAAWANKQRLEFLEQHLEEEKDKERLRSLQRLGATSVFSAIPSLPELTIASIDFPLVISSFLGTQFPFSPHPQACLCDKVMSADSRAEHFSLCPHRRAQATHDKVAQCLAALARDAGHSTSPASSLLHFAPDSNIVADLRIVSNTPAHKDTIVDVSIRNTIAPSSFDSHGKPKAVIAEAERAKTAKHGPHVSAMNCSFCPFILESFGHLGPQAKTLFNSLVREIPVDSFFPANWSASSPSAYWSQRFAVGIWGGHAAETRELYRRSLNKHGF
jgi:hypothetical protein